MRHPSFLALLLGGTVALSACGQMGQTDVTRAVSGAARAEADSIREIMLTVADPREAVSYFKRQVQDDPDDLDKQRDLAGALIKAGRTTEGKQAWQSIVDSDGSTNEDLVFLADAMIRGSEWPAAKIVLDTIPPTHETFARYRLEAMVADSNQQWTRSDSFYETAIGLTTTPAGVLNNWGYSKLTRGDTEAAERLFIEAITYDEGLFTAKNNLILARAARRVYSLPIVPMTQEERAQLLHTAGLAAAKQGDVDISRNLLQDAIDTHPRHFEAAVRALQALNG
ncbi:Flp pilus assembly protein TadD, contains TPR repeats [Jannaschia faecimaris]|uniref:Flp pilus assembly protein TadD, contains TPR repeats n=1 Tax=Jannaschia faecimaris TaxID=1244108 RepID=A0A1H3L458_9RHOB|nr:tetratricopeptide repeat protein [Jannaschia faecimaris]SDY58999.1 Flp pilus assembly protein TadD, contains TPR repeats [Jannaschia faecimaris]